MLKWMFILGAAALLNGCAAVATIPVASSVLPASTGNADFRSATTVKLEQANFVVLRTNVMGQSKGFALLGLVTLVPARFTTALDRLYQEAQMQPGHSQTLVNLVMERSSTFWILFSIPKVSIRADTIEFTRSIGTDPSLPGPPVSPERGSARP